MFLKSRLNLNGRRDSRVQIYSKTAGYLSNYCDRGKMDVNFTRGKLKFRVLLDDRRDRRFFLTVKLQDLCRILERGVRNSNFIGLLNNSKIQR